MDIQLTKNFKLSEFLESTTINDLKDVNNRNKLLALQNNLTINTVGYLYSLASHVLQPVRDKLGMVISVSSGYRCPQLNNLVKGVANSQHLVGQAADVYCMDNYHLLELLKDTDYDQLICYGPQKSPRFIHVSYVSKATNRHQYLIKK